MLRAINGFYVTSDAAFNYTVPKIYGLGIGETGGLGDAKKVNITQLPITHYPFTQHKLMLAADVFCLSLTSEEVPRIPSGRGREHHLSRPLEAIA